MLRDCSSVFWWLFVFRITWSSIPVWLRLLGWFCWRPCYTMTALDSSIGSIYMYLSVSAYMAVVFSEIRWDEILWFWTDMACVLDGLIRQWTCSYNAPWASYAIDRSLVDRTLCYIERLQQRFWWLFVFRFTWSSIPVDCDCLVGFAGDHVTPWLLWILHSEVFICTWALVHTWR